MPKGKPGIIARWCQQKRSGVVETKCRQALLEEIEQVVAEAKSGSHGGEPFLDSLHYGLTLAGLMNEAEVKQSWARGEARAAKISSD